MFARMAGDQEQVRSVDLLDRALHGWLSGVEGWGGGGGGVGVDDTTQASFCQIFMLILCDGTCRFLCMYLAV